MALLLETGQDRTVVWGCWIGRAGLSVVIGWHCRWLLFALVPGAESTFDRRQIVVPMPEDEVGGERPVLVREVRTITVVSESCASCV